MFHRNMNSLQSRMQIEIAHNVFRHKADSAKVDGLRDAVVDDIYNLLRKPMVFSKFHASYLSPDEWAQMREKYKSLLEYGRLNKRLLANELIWKWTEATGKYLGCQFWSLKAKELFDREVASNADPKVVEKMLQSKLRRDDAKITHEHVYPIKDVTLWLDMRRETLDRDEIRIHLERLCVGCVVLESEHKKMGVSDHKNPWIRYKEAGVALAANPALPNVQRMLIEEAGLLKKF
jgi:hypothetical protein